MDLKLICEIITIVLVGLRIYILESMQIKSVADKMFAIYYLKNHYPLIGYIILFYITEIVILEIFVLKIVDIALIFLATIDMFIIYRHIFISLKTDDKEDFLDTLIKRTFSTLTYSEYQNIKNELTKPQPKWMLYLTEISVVFFAIWAIELQDSLF